MPSSYLRMEQVLKAFADDGRIEIMKILYDSNTPLIVSEIRPELTVKKDLSPGQIFGHLKKLVTEGIAYRKPVFRDEGPTVEYAMTPRGRDLYKSVMEAYERFEQGMC